MPKYYSSTKGFFHISKNYSILCGCLYNVPLDNFNLPEYNRVGEQKSLVWNITFKSNQDSFFISDLSNWNSCIKMNSEKRLKFFNFKFSSSNLSTWQTDGTSIAPLQHLKYDHRNVCFKWLHFLARVCTQQTMFCEICI